MGINTLLEKIDALLNEAVDLSNIYTDIKKMASSEMKISIVKRFNDPIYGKIGGKTNMLILLHVLHGRKHGVIAVTEKGKVLFKKVSGPIVNRIEKDADGTIQFDDSDLNNLEKLFGKVINEFGGKSFLKGKEGAPTGDDIQDEETLKKFFISKLPKKVTHVSIGSLKASGRKFVQVAFDNGKDINFDDDYESYTYRYLLDLNEFIYVTSDSDQISRDIGEQPIPIANKIISKVTSPKDAVKFIKKNKPKFRNIPESYKEPTMSILEKIDNLIIEGKYTAAKYKKLVKEVGPEISAEDEAFDIASNLLRDEDGLKTFMNKDMKVSDAQGRLATDLMKY